MSQARQARPEEHVQGSAQEEVAKGGGLKNSPGGKVLVSWGRLKNRPQKKKLLMRRT